MKNVILATAAAATLLLLPFAAGDAGARGPDVTRLQNAGWVCAIVIAGEPHCIPGAQFPPSGQPSVPILVFGADGSFRGTELLIREDLYAGQPCPQDNLASYFNTGIGYFACHHYDQTAP